MAAHFCGSRNGWPRSAPKTGAELIAVDSNPLDSVWSEPPRPRRLAPRRHSRPAIFGRKRSRTSCGASSSKSRDSASTRWVLSDSHAVGVDLQHPRRRRLAYTAAAILCAGAERRPPPRFSSITANCPNSARDHLEQTADVEEPDRADAKAHRACASRAHRLRFDSANRPPTRLSRPESLPRAASRCAASDPVSLLKAVKNATENRRHTHGASARCGWRSRDSSPGSTARRRRGAPDGGSTPSRRWRRSAATTGAAEGRPRSRPSPAPGRTAPSCTTALPARPTGGFRQAICC